ncbi:MAG: 4-carboxymuconolactone decarboxylase [Xanthobacteraceae bacterium]
MSEDRYRRGQQIRESVLGPAHATRSAKNRTPFNADFQDFLMEYAWGTIWARPGLDRKTRSMITIAMLVGMGKLDELKLHIRATGNTGVSRDEVKELLMHAAIYCGVPAAFGAFQIAAQIFDEMDGEAAAKT